MAEGKVQRIMFTFGGEPDRAAEIAEKLRLLLVELGIEDYDMYVQEMEVA